MQISYSPLYMPAITDWVEFLEMKWRCREKKRESLRAKKPVHICGSPKLRRVSKSPVGLSITTALTLSRAHEDTLVPSVPFVAVLHSGSDITRALDDKSIQKKPANTKEEVVLSSSFHCFYVHFLVAIHECEKMRTKELQTCEFNLCN